MDNKKKQEKHLSKKEESPKKNDINVRIIMDNREMQLDTVGCKVPHIAA